MVCEQATKGREEGGGGGQKGLFRILASFFTISSHSELLSSSLRMPFSYLIPHPEILANPVSRQDILRLLDSRITQIPRIPLQTLYVAEEGPVRRPKGT